MPVFLTNSSWKITKEAIKSLNKHGISSIAGDSHVPLYNSLFNSKVTKYPPPETDSFVNSIYEICNKHQIDTIFPMSDLVAVSLARNKEMLNEVSEIPIPEYTDFIKAHDKFETYKISKLLNIPVPNTYYFNTKDELIEFSETASYPLIIKPRMGGGASLFIHRINDSRELLHYHSELTSKNYLPIVQEYIPGSSEQMHMINVLYDKKNELIAYFMAKKIREYPPNGGITCCGVSIFEPILLEYAQKLFSALNWYGVAEIEFKLDPRDNNFKLIEINPRFWQYLKLPISCGVDFPFLLYESVIGNNIEYCPEYKLDVKYINISKDIPSAFDLLLKSKSKKVSLGNIVNSYRGEKVFSSKNVIESLLWRI